MAPIMRVGGPALGRSMLAALALAALACLIGRFTYGGGWGQPEPALAASLWAREEPTTIKVYKLA